MTKPKTLLPRERRDESDEPTHWGWATRGGHTDPIRGLIDVKPNPDHWTDPTVLDADGYVIPPEPVEP